MMTSSHEKPLTLLLVEDEPDHAQVFQAMLARVRMPPPAVSWARTLESALERLGGGGVDLVLLDLTLSDSLGLETFDRVRAASPAVPVVLLTSIDDDAVVRAARRKGAAGFLAKHRLTLESLGRAIEAASGSGAPEPPPRMSAQA